MAGFFHKLKGAGSGSSKSDNGTSVKNKRDEIVPETTPLEKLLEHAGPVREDGSDKFFGLENVRHPRLSNQGLMANPVLAVVWKHMALYYSESFRENVVNYPIYPLVDTRIGDKSKVHVTIRAAAQTSGAATSAVKPKGTPGLPVKPEDKPDTPEYKKKHAMIKGPVLELAQDISKSYGMEECTFTGLKDIFNALIESKTRTGVLSPQRFLDIFKRDNELFRNSNHQDAHEFYGLVLNDVIASVEANARRIQESGESRIGLTQLVAEVVGASAAVPSPPAAVGTGWVHDIFEGVLTSETRCLTCETASQRDETFLDLSIDLEEHSSVTACLQKFSAEEMLCERNKFHCDHCGGLQEAEKRMKIKKLPKVLALHLKRFKYTEDYSRLQKLFHRVVYPYHLRMFNTTEDAEDPDRMYELYAVVVHIGGNAYHGHYVSVIKTRDRGWLLFDDEMVEPVDKHFVRNFFGDRPGMACAYVLFYQEVSFEKVREEQDAEGVEEIKLVSQTADLVQDTESVGCLQRPTRQHMQATAPVGHREPLAVPTRVRTSPQRGRSSGELSSPASSTHPRPSAPLPGPVFITETEKATTVPQSSKPADDRREDKDDLGAHEAACRAQDEEQPTPFESRHRAELGPLKQAGRPDVAEVKQKKKEADEDMNGERPKQSLLNRANKMSRKSFPFLTKDRGVKRGKTCAGKNGRDGKVTDVVASAVDLDMSEQHLNGASPVGNPDRPEQPASPEKPERSRKDRFSFGLGKKKSQRVLS